MELTFGAFGLTLDVLGLTVDASGSLWTPLGFTLMPLGSIWGVLGTPWRSLGLILEPIGSIWGCLGRPKLIQSGPGWHLADIVKTYENCRFFIGLGVGGSPIDTRIASWRPWLLILTAWRATWVIWMAGWGSREPRRQPGDPLEHPSPQKV